VVATLRRLYAVVGSGGLSYTRGDIDTAKKSQDIVSINVLSSVAAGEPVIKGEKHNDITIPTPSTYQSARTHATQR